MGVDEQNTPLTFPDSAKNMSGDPGIQTDEEKWRSIQFLNSVFLNQSNSRLLFLR